jgi:1-acyl-sn-glycerol-3-phosphate acyltransferase
MRHSLRVFYKSIIVDGSEFIVPNKPLLIASTHPNSFLDAIILGTVLDREMFFLARSDVFKQKWADYILRKMNLIPIYRLQEGHENLNKNDITFKSCYDILERNGAVLIFAEGISLIDKKVRPPKKGLARIGFGAEDKNQFQLGIEVIPIGINYEYASQFRNRIVVKIEKPIPLSDYSNDFKKNQNTAYQNLNKRLFSSLKKASIESDEEILFDLLADQICTSKYSFESLKSIQNKITSIKIGSPDSINKLIKDAIIIRNLEQKHNFNSGLISRKKSSIPLRLLLFLPACFGFILNITPVLIATKFSDKKVKLIEFYASVRLVLSSILWLLWALIILFFVGFLNGVSLIIVPLIMISCGKAYIKLIELNKISKSVRNYNRFKDSIEYNKYKKSFDSINELIPNSIKG